MPTVLLVHCDGTNGSTTFTDVSPSAHALTAFTGAAVETVQVKFGTGAAGYSGGASTVQTVNPGSSDFNFLSSPFTIEAWAYASGAASVNALVAQFSNISGGGWYFGAVSGNLAFWYFDGSGTEVQFASTTAIPTGAWHFYTADRDAGGTLRLYIDGVVVASTSAPAFQSSGSWQLNIGNSNMASHGWSIGYIDEVRITNGAALYAGAFTPPTGPFTNGGAAASQARVAILA